MFKKITTLFLAVIIFTTASSVNIFGQTKTADETQAILKNSEPNSEPKNDKLQLAFLRKENSPTAAELVEKETMRSYQKQKSQGQKFSTSTKILIGIGIAAAVIGVVFFRQVEIK